MLTRWNHLQDASGVLPLDAYSHYRLANVVWRHETDRAVGSSSFIGFKYSDRDITGLRENALQIFQIDPVTYEISKLENQDIWPAQNIIYGKLSKAGCYYVIGYKNLVYGINDHVLNSANVGLIKNLGAVQRTTFYWSHYEPNAPVNGVHQYIMPARDAEIKALSQANNIPLLGVVHGAPQWAAKWKAGTTYSSHVSCPPNGEENLTNFLLFLDHLMTLFPEIEYWEIWNEPNLDQFWGGEPNASEYSLMLSRAYSRIKSNNPSAKVIGGILSTYPSASYQFDAFLEDMYSQGVAGNFDIFSMHDYRTIEQIQQFVEIVHGIMNTNAEGHKQIWITEWDAGQTNQSRTPYITEEQQAINYVDRLSLYRNIDYIGACFSYPFIDNYYDPNAKWSGIVRGDLTAKPAYNEYKHVIDHWR